MFSRMMSNIINNAVESLENKDEGTVGYWIYSKARQSRNLCKR
jgi:hypothetical protein